MKKQLLRQFPVVLGLIILTLGLFLPTSCTKDIFPGAPDDDLVEMEPFPMPRSPGETSTFCFFKDCCDICVAK